MAKSKKKETDPQDLPEAETEEVSDQTEGQSGLLSDSWADNTTDIEPQIKGLKKIVKDHEQDEAVMSAEELCQQLAESGTGRDRIDLLKNFCAQFKKASAEEALEWMKEYPDLFKAGTIQKAGRMIRGAGYHYSDPGASSATIIHQMGAEQENLRRSLEESNSKLAALSMEVSELRKENTRLSLDLQEALRRSGD